MPRAALTLELLNRLTELERLHDAVADFGRLRRVPEEALFQLQVVLEEVASNVIRHALPAGERRFLVRLEAAGGDLVAEVEDDGPPFDPLSRPEPDLSLPPAERPLGGLGVVLVRRLMDDVDYRRDRGRNVLRLRKRLPPTPEGPV